MARICEMFETASNAMRQEIISTVTPEIGFLFVSFSNQMAITAVRRNDKQLLIRGLEALAIQSRVADWRDSTINLAVLYHSARKIGADPDALMEYVSGMVKHDAVQKALQLIRDAYARKQRTGRLRDLGRDHFLRRIHIYQLAKKVKWVLRRANRFVGSLDAHSPEVKSSR